MLISHRWPIVRWLWETNKHLAWEWGNITWAPKNACKISELSIRIMTKNIVVGTAIKVNHNSPSCFWIVAAAIFICKYLILWSCCLVFLTMTGLTPDLSPQGGASQIVLKDVHSYYSVATWRACWHVPWTFSDQWWYLSLQMHNMNILKFYFTGTQCRCLLQLTLIPWWFGLVCPPTRAMKEAIHFYYAPQCSTFDILQETLWSPHSCWPTFWTGHLRFL